MSERRTLITIDYHSDDETGMYRVGEIDFGLHGELDSYIDHYGYEGVKELSNTLAHMAWEIRDRYFKRTRPLDESQRAQSA